MEGTNPHTGRTAYDASIESTRDIRTLIRSRPARRTGSPWVWAATFVGFAILATLSFYRPGGQAGAADNVAGSDQSRIERGKYLVTIAGCNDCHTPYTMTAQGPAPDWDRMLSGHPEQFKLPPAPRHDGQWLWSGAATNTAFAGPWGVSYAMNLTPDKNTGLGIWTEEMFVNAIRLGRHWGQSGARPIQPPMPWPSFSKMTDADLKAIWAYLRSIPPVTNHVPDFEPPEEK